MKKTLAILLSLFFFNFAAKAEVSFVKRILNKNHDKEYLEDKPRFQEIDIHTIDSPLKDLVEPAKKRLKFWENLEDNYFTEYKDGIGEIDGVTKEIAFNKITGFSNGVIDVTYQVRKGVIMAIKETFGGYAEYQRRKQVEEVVNTTFRNRRLIGDIFIRNNREEVELPKLRNTRSTKTRGIFSYLSDKTYSYSLIKDITKRQVVKDIRLLIRNISLAILLLLIMIKVFWSTKNGYSLTETFSKPVLILIFASLAIIMGHQFLKVNLEFLNTIANALILNMNDLSLNQFMGPDDTWEYFASDNGYFPTFMLSIFDMLSQIFIGFFYLAIVAFIVFGMVFYPIWVVISIFNPVKFIALDAYLNWLKANFALVFSPVLIIIFKIISFELSFDQLFMSILAKSLSFYSIPLIILFICFKTKPIIKLDYEKIDYSSQLKEEIKDLLSSKNA
jgi:hypothetical protein